MKNLDILIADMAQRTVETWHDRIYEDLCLKLQDMVDKAAAEAEEELIAKLTAQFSEDED